MGAEETLERYELWSASAQEDSTESVDSTDKETVKDNGLEEATESGSTDSHPGVKIGSQRLDHNAAKTGILRLAGYSINVAG